MNEMTKSLVFGVVAAGSALLAMTSRPSVSMNVESLVDKPLFVDFTDPLQAKSLKVVRFDETLSKLDSIEVSEKDGLWSLPSHAYYPADAENRVRDATAPFVDLTPLAVVSENDGDHAVYGVVEPGEGKSALGDQGVGTLVSVKNANGDSLRNLIIGKPEKKRPELRFVRRPGQRMVYLAKVNPDSLPLRFEDWIERDLLKLNAFDIKQLVLKDYSFQVASGLRGPVPDYEQRLEVTMSDNNGTWGLDKLMVPKGRGLAPSEIGENEELNQERLNGLKDALDRLEIVDVERKPAGLGSDLRADQGFFNDEAGVDSLVERGFYPVQMGKDGAVELLSTDGEVLVRTKEGVEYVLRFGRVKGVDEKSEEGKLNRYLLVSARVNDAEFPEPALMPLPETVDDLGPPAATEAAPVSPGANALPATPAVPEVPAAPPAGDSSQSTPGRDASTLTRTVALQEAEAPAEAPAAESAAAENAAASSEPVEAAADAEPAANERAAEATETPATDAEAVAEPASTPAAAEPAAETKLAAPAESPEEAAQRLATERERITKENQRKIDERNANLAKAQKKVGELNYRFADWYYVISEDVYKKIHLGQTDILREKTAAKEEGFGVDALRGLQQALPPGLGAPQP